MQLFLENKKKLCYNVWNIKSFDGCVGVWDVIFFVFDYIFGVNNGWNWIVVLVNIWRNFIWNILDMCVIGYVMFFFYYRIWDFLF